MDKIQLYHFFVSIFNFLPLKKNKIFFLGYYGSQYGCNPKYLCEYIINNHPGWDVVWGFTQPERHEVYGIRKVRYLSLHFFYELCTSQVLITNYRMPAFYKKRNKQLYIQTWHSSLRLKAIEADAINSIPVNYIEMAKHDSQQINILLSGCKKSTEIFQHAFWYNGLIASTGTPRFDVLMRPDKKRSLRIRRSIGLDDDSHIVLYAPTFRENHGLDAYNLDIHKLCQYLKQKWGGKWKALLRLHSHLLSTPLEGPLKNCLDVTKYDDIQELLCISDVVVSDYSSLIFDFAFTRRPCFLYVPDMDEYLKTERHLYFKLDELPFPLIRNNNQLSEAIQKFDEHKYYDAIDVFMKQIGTYETGHACENVYNLMVNHLSK